MKTKTAVTPPAANLASNGTAKRLLMMALPVIVAVLLLFVPVPDGLPPYAWHYFAIFVGVIVGLIFRTAAGRRDRSYRRRGDCAVQPVGAL